MFNSTFIRNTGGFAGAAIYGDNCEFINSIFETVETGAQATWYFDRHSSGTINNLTLNTDTGGYWYLYSSGFTISNLHNREQYRTST